MKKYANLALTFLLTLLFPLIAKYSLNLFYPIVNEASFGGALFLETLFYMVQTGLVLLFMNRFMGLSLSEIGFNTKNSEISLKVVKYFLVIWLLFIVSFYIVSFHFYSGFEAYVKGFFSPRLRSFGLDMLNGVACAGLGEEPLFRALVLLMLSRFSMGEWRIGKLKIPHIAFFAGFFFMLAHIAYNVYPFEITHLDYLQLGSTFILGVFWSVLYLRTKSLLGPILAHTGANGIQFLCGYLFSVYIY